MFAPRFSPASRGSLLLAAIPLATMVIHRAMLQLEDLIAERVQVLTSLETRIAAREAALGVLARYAPKDETPPEMVDPSGGSFAETRCAALHPVPGTDTCARQREHDGPHVGREAIWWDTVPVPDTDPDAGPAAAPGCTDCGTPSVGIWFNGPRCDEHAPVEASTR